MDLERVAAVIRPRSPWEAVDLGFGMVRAWWKPVWTAWLATVAPAWWLIFSLAWFLSGKPWAGFLAVWWLRPLFDRVPLYVVSRHLFGSSPSSREVRHDLPRLWTRHLWAALTLQRLDPARSFDLPVWELEGLRGSERKVRTDLLQRVSRSNAIWLTLACFVLEVFFVLAVFELASLLTPSTGWSETVEIAAADTGDPTTAFWWWAAAAAFLALTVIEPFYVAAGFSLYLSRRIHLEGWDVEIAFRRLAARLGKTAAMVLLVSLALLPLPLVPREPEGGLPAIKAPAKAVREVLKEPEFQTSKKQKVWRLKTDWDFPRSQRKPTPAPDISFDFLKPLVLIVAAALLTGLVALIIGGLLRLRRSPGGGGEPASRGPLPAAVFGLDIRPESLPADVPGAAWSAWERGEPALALGLLYRAAIVFLVSREGLPVRESWTEGDCVDFVQRKDRRERADYFARLTRAWQTTAYAHRPPEAEEVRALCTAWSRHFTEAEAA